VPGSHRRIGTSRSQWQRSRGQPRSEAIGGQVRQSYTGAWGQLGGPPDGVLRGSIDPAIEMRTRHLLVYDP